jgi:hypothetical protein
VCAVFSLRHDAVERPSNSSLQPTRKKPRAAERGRWASQGYSFALPLPWSRAVYVRLSKSRVGLFDPQVVGSSPTRGATNPNGLATRQTVPLAARGTARRRSVTPPVPVLSLPRCRTGTLT